VQDQMLSEACSICQGLAEGQHLKMRQHVRCGGLAALKVKHRVRHSELQTVIAVLWQERSGHNCW
jgi:hypothetical protein